MSIKRLMSDIKMSDVRRIENMGRKRKIKERASLLRKISILNAISNIVKDVTVFVDVVVAFAEIIINTALVKETMVFIIISVVISMVIRLIIEIIKARYNALLEILKN